MPKRSLALMLSLTLLLAPSRARAGVIGDIVQAILIIAVVGAATVGTAETLTAVATYKNYRTSSRREEASGGWVGVGFVGGLANLGLGGYLIYDGLPSSYQSTCYRPDPAAEKEIAYPCTERQKASAGEIIGGTIVLGFGALATGMAVSAIRNEPSGTSNAGTVSPGSAPASVGFTLPLLRF